MNPINFRTLLLGALMSAAISLAGCRAQECTQMTECCAEITGLDGVGQACGAMSESTSNPDTCASVTQTIRFMLEDRKKPIPQACQAR